MTDWTACAYRTPDDESTPFERTRTEATAGSCNGLTNCGLETEACCDDPDCTGTTTTEWTACAALTSTTLPDGTFGRTRTTQACGACNPTSQAECCPVACSETDLNGEVWGACGYLSGVDGSFGKTRVSVVTPQTCGGDDTCAAQSQSVCCPVDCTYSDWTTCGATDVTQSRTVASAGTCLGDSSCATETQPCECSLIDCVLSPIGDWSSCSVNTVTGISEKTRSSTVTTLGSCLGDMSCAAVTETECCPVNCVVSAWSDWSACALQTDGTLVKTRTKTVTDGSCSGDTTCAPAAEVVCCPQNCQVTMLADAPWGECVELGTSIPSTWPAADGSYGRTRSTVVTPATCGGFTGGSCQISSEAECCPINCEAVPPAWAPTTFDESYTWTYGAEFGNAYPCGTGTRTRQWVPAEATCGGNDAVCRDDLETGTVQLCCPSDCIESMTAWSNCAALPGQPACDQGVQTRSLNQQAASCSGKPCSLACSGTKEGLDGICEQYCDLDPCPVDCVGEFSEWGACTDNGCGQVNIQRRVYSVTQRAANHGSACLKNDGFTETRDCPSTCCPVDCGGRFGDWTTCSQVCDGGLRSRTYVIDHVLACGGAECEHPNGFVETEACGTDPCDCPCGLGMWSDFLTAVQQPSCSALNLDRYCPCNALEATTQLQQTITISGATLGVIADDFGVALPRYIQSLLQKKLSAYRGDLTVKSSDEKPHGTTYTSSVVIEYTVRGADNHDHLRAVSDLLQSENLISEAMTTANVLTDHTVVSACVRNQLCTPPPGTESVTHAMTLSDHDLMSMLPGTNEREAFETSFIDDMAALMGISPLLIVINGMQSGSVIVDFQIMSIGTPEQAAASGAPTPAEALEKLDTALAAGGVKIAGSQAVASKVTTVVRSDDLQEVADDALDDDLLWAIFTLFLLVTILTAVVVHLFDYKFKSVQTRYSELATDKPSTTPDDAEDPAETMAMIPPRTGMPQDGRVGLPQVEATESEVKLMITSQMEEKAAQLRTASGDTESVSSNSIPEEAY